MTAEATYDAGTGVVTVTGHRDLPEAGAAALVCARDHARMLSGTSEEGPRMTYPTVPLPDGGH